MCHQNSARELEAQGFLPSFKRALREAGKQQHPGCTSKKTPLLFHRAPYMVPFLSVCPTAESTVCNRLEPRTLLQNSVSTHSFPHQLTPFLHPAGIRLPAAQKPPSLPAGRPGEGHPTLIKQLEFTVHRELHCFLCSNKSLPHGSSLGSSQCALRGFKGLKRFLSSVPLERDAAALTS